jgi:hypothetical protein
LVRAGAMVFGPPPSKSPSLQDYLKCDAEVKQLAQEIWGDCDGVNIFAHSYGKGRVLWRKTEVKTMEQYGDFAAITNILNQENVPPDFESDGPVRFTHRRDGDTDIYFVVNREPRTVDANCVFRVTGKQPELFDPMTGETRTLPQFTEHDGRTSVPMTFEPGQSFFVVFRSPISMQQSAASNFPAMKPVAELGGSWEVHFDPKWGGLERVIFKSLDDWSQRPEPSIKYYSGKAVYKKSFELHEKTPGQRYFLDLGDVKDLARVRLNGHDLGVAWCAPWRVEATKVINEGTNQLEIEVANLWPNRLIGDLSLPPDQRLTWVAVNPFKKDSPLLPSGLLGPVRILIEPETRLKP